MTDKEKMEWLISEADVLAGHFSKPSTPGFQLWQSEAERFLIKRFGQDSFEYKKFKEIRFSPAMYTDDSAVVRRCKEGLTTSKLMFKTYLEEMDESGISEEAPEHKIVYDKVFVVHGHDGELKLAVARLVEKQDLEAIILSEKANKGKTIIEKFEENSDVGGAICLFTADDFGRAKADSSDNARARQNVVLETGYFMGKLGRNHVVLLAEKGIEMPSDLSGVVYTNTANWQFDVLKELNAMGYKVDLNKLL